MNGGDVILKLNKHIAPTPQPSHDDLVSGLEVLNNKKTILQNNEKQPSNSSGLISPVSPKQQSLDYVTDEEEEEVNVINDEDYPLTKEESGMYDKQTNMDCWN